MCVLWLIDICVSRLIDMTHRNIPRLIDICAMTGKRESATRASSLLDYYLKNHGFSSWEQHLQTHCTRLQHTLTWCSKRAESPASPEEHADYKTNCSTRTKSNTLQDSLASLFELKWAWVVGKCKTARPSRLQHTRLQNTQDSREEHQLLVLKQESWKRRSRGSKFAVCCNSVLQCVARSWECLDTNCIVLQQDLALTKRRNCRWYVLRNTR